ncbi:hypothetical protein B0H12DRAFT_1074830 [Mycena haematopus]|nr:hypothetical protein B0H12DRAFT_1074830 [Mycena haematopus]
MTSSAETLRLFGPVFRPHADISFRQRAVLRKALELVSEEEVRDDLDGTDKLRVSMGGHNLFNFYRFGTVYTKIGQAECSNLDQEARDALQDYLDKYDAYFTKQGKQFVVRNPDAKDALQAAEQAWHDWILRYRGVASRPAWAMEPLPTLRPVRVKRTIIDISDDDDESVVSAPRPKKNKFLGTVDLTQD